MRKDVLKMTVALATGAIFGGGFLWSENVWLRERLESQRGFEPMGPSRPGLIGGSPPRMKGLQIEVPRGTSGGVYAPLPGGAHNALIAVVSYCDDGKVLLATPEWVNGGKRPVIVPVRREETK